MKGTNGSTSNTPDLLSDIKNRHPELSFRESVDLYRQLIHSLPYAIYICDCKGYITLYNSKAVELWGKEPVMGTDLWCGSWKIYDKDGRPVALDSCPMATTLKTGMPVRGEELIIERPDGSRRNVLPHPQPLFDESGNLAGAVNILVDITDQKKIDEGMARLASIVQSSEDAIISKTLQGIVTSWNDAATRIFGFTAEEMIGGPITRIIPLNRFNEEPMILEQIAKGENVDHFETKRLTKDGRILDISLTISPIKDSRDRIIGASKIARDITRQKEIERMVRESEERYKSLASQLEERVNEKTNELHETNRELQRSNIELEQFAYIASHDLQEPLRKIRIFGKMLLEEESDDLKASAKDYLNRITKAADRMQSLIEALLEFSRTATTSKIFEEKNLNELVEEVRKELQDQIEEKQAVLQVSLLPQLTVIPFQFKQMLYNIISNSLKYSKEDVSPVIGITSSYVRSENIHQKNIPGGTVFCKLTVTDNGIGFESQYSERIFELFQRLHGRNEYSGSGLGLAICKKIAKNHNGFITAEAEPGKGAAIHIYIPTSK